MSAPNATGFANHALARMLFWHLPCALVCTLFFCAAPYFSLKYLKTKESHWDLRASAAMEIGMVTGMLTLLTGILFSWVQWLSPWNWDPRQTSFLLVMLIVGAYFALRSAFSDAEERAARSAVYSLASTLPLLFLIFVFPRVLESLHPSTTLVSSKGLDPIYKSIFYGMLLMFLTLCIWLYKLRVRAGFIEEAANNANARLGSSNDSAPTGVVRPVSLSSEDR
jgi:heme exporter protein C